MLPPSISHDTQLFEAFDSWEKAEDILLDPEKSRVIDNDSLLDLAMYYGNPKELEIIFLKYPVLAQNITPFIAASLIYLTDAEQDTTFNSILTSSAFQKVFKKKGDADVLLSVLTQRKYMWPKLLNQPYFIPLLSDQGLIFLLKLNPEKIVSVLKRDTHILHANSINQLMLDICLSTNKGLASRKQQIKWLTSLLHCASIMSVLTPFMKEFITKTIRSG